MNKIATAALAATLILGLSHTANARRIAPAEPNTQTAPTAVSALSAAEQQNRDIVVSFYRQVFEQHQVAAAVKRYIGSEYIQHNPYVPDGGKPFQDYFVGHFKQNPQAKSVIKRVIVQGDLVVLHVESKQHPDERGVAVVDIFRVKDGKIVEHWDVQQAVPEQAANGNTMF